MKHFLPWAIYITIVLSHACDTKADPYDSHIKYVQQFLRHYPKRLERALSYMPTIEGYSAIHAIDPLVTVVVISCESSWHTGAKGHIGEHGLMQLHGVCTRGYDMAVPEQQIQAGIACLAASRDSCDGSLRQMLTKYQSGACIARTKRTKQRINYRMRIIEDWRAK